MATEIDVDSVDPKKPMFGVEPSPDAPFERSAPIEDGPLFVNIEEKMPDLAEPSEDQYVKGPKLDVDRRDFMRLFGVGAAAATATGCIQRPLEKVIPYVNQPVDQVPGLAVNYATTGGGPLSNGLVVRTREGRPTKIEGNPEHPLSQGATNSKDQAALQALYHPERRRSPMARYGNKRFGEVTWEEAYAKMAEKLKDASGKVAFFTGGGTGSRTAFLESFLEKVGADKNNIYTYEPNSLYAEISKAHGLAFCADGLPRTDLRRTNLVVGVGGDFLDTGVATVYESKSFAAGHSFKFGRKGRFVQFESRLTSTGGKATDRHVISVGDELGVTLLLVEALLGQANVRGSKAEHDEIRKVLSASSAIMQKVKGRVDGAVLSKLAKDLLAGNSLVMVGHSSATSEWGVQTQLAGIFANILIGAYGKTLHFDRGWIKPPVKAGDVKRFLDDAKNIEVLIVLDSNPAFELPESSGIKEALKGIGTVVSMQALPCETDDYAHLALNTHHFLESWGDVENVAGFWSSRQPVVRPQYQSQQAEDVLLWVLAKMDRSLPYASYRDYINERWRAVHEMVRAKVDYQTFFKAILRRGFVGKLEKRSISSLRSVSSHFANMKLPAGDLKFVAYLDPRLGAGEGAALPLLQEVGDPLTTVAWDTWVAISPITVRKMGLRYNEVVKLETSQGSINVAVYPLPGLAPDTVAVPRGNGHNGVSRVTTGVGVDPLVLLPRSFDKLSGMPVTSGVAVKVTTTGKFYRLCAMQKSNDLGNRSDIVKKMPLAKAAANMKKQVDLDTVPDLYPALEKGDYLWGMSIDLDKCTGCSVCMVACAQENNVAQAGREQILMGREMHWIRLDRYFSGPVENPEVVIQPVMCQQCNHAPCEAVCPVFATTHDPEGINAQTYNRCVGTRYCANACPYKVRRFNWYTQKWNVIGEEERDRNIRALNPDVTVRTKGVMEKCSFCLQRIRDAKHAALDRGPEAKIADGEMKTACQQACPSDAIVFGNLDDPRSRAARMRKDNRAYLMLGGDPEHKHYGIKTLPNVSYLAKVEHDGTEGAKAPSGGHHHHPMKPHGHK